MENSLTDVLEPTREQLGASTRVEALEHRPVSDTTRNRFILSRIFDRPAIAAWVFGVLSLCFLLVGITKPKTLYYDEGLYVSEARGFLHGEIDAGTRMHNLARPPFGKFLLAYVIKLAGDNAFGWRIGPAVCGALTVVAVYLWTLLLLRDSLVASFAAGLTLLNNFLFVMSRIAMMDAFFVSFMMWSLVAYTAALTLNLSVSRRRGLFLCSGVLIGLSGACKLNAIDTLAVLVFVSFALLWIARRSPAWSIPALSRPSQNMQEIGTLTLFASLVAVPCVVYTLTFWPLCRALHQPFDISEFIAIHRNIWFLSTNWATNKAITSLWYTWPLNISPQRGLSYLIGNPVVAWGGVAALFVCLRRFWKSANLAEALVVLLFAANFFQWAVTPEKGLLYYYYYPSVMILGVAIAVASRSLPRTIFHLRVSLLVLVLAAAVFLWCYPKMAHLEAPWDCALGCWN